MMQRRAVRINRDSGTVEGLAARGTGAIFKAAWNKKAM